MIMAYSIQKLYSGNLFKGINTRDVRLVRYLGPCLKSTREELKKMDQRTRKVMTMYKALHPRDDVDRLSVLRREGEKRIATIEDSVNTLIKRLEDHIQKRVRKTDYSHQENTNDIRTSGMTITRKQTEEEKQLYGCFKGLTSDISHKKMWT